MEPKNTMSKEEAAVLMKELDEMHEEVEAMKKIFDCYCRKCGNLVVCEHSKDQPHEPSICGECTC